MGTSQLLSVPYAMTARTVENDNVGDGSETSITAGTNVTVTGIGTVADPYIVGRSTLSIGDEYQGGYIFWLDDTGEHGLIAAMEDQSDGLIWYNGSSTDTEAHGEGIKAGEMNTILIIANQGSDCSTYAAGLCANYTKEENSITYGDWYLPSSIELKLIYNNLHNIATPIGNFADESYWSSTENNSGTARTCNFNTGIIPSSTKHSGKRVRAVRAF
jgi:hypothetical protein